MDTKLGGGGGIWYSFGSGPPKMGVKLLQAPSVPIRKTKKKKRDVKETNFSSLMFTKKKKP